MPTVNIKSNPVVAKVGSLDSDATSVFSGITRTTDTSGYDIKVSVVIYQVVEKKTGIIVNIDSDKNHSGKANVISCTTQELKIILKNRTKYRARVRSQNETNWSNWVHFKTRDKRYQTPDAIAQLTDDTDDTATQKGSRTINVTNNASSTVVIDLELNKGHTGARVKNTDKFYNDTTSITTSENGVLVVNDGTIKFTNRGATIDNR